MKNKEEIELALELRLRNNKILIDLVDEEIVEQAYKDFDFYDTNNKSLANKIVQFDLDYLQVHNINDRINWNFQWKYTDEPDTNEQKILDQYKKDKNYKKAVSALIEEYLIQYPDSNRKDARENAEQIIDELRHYGMV